MQARKVILVVSLLIFLCASAPISDSSQGKKILHPWVEALQRHYEINLNYLPRPYGTGNYTAHSRTAPSIHLVYAKDSEPALSASFISGLLNVFPEVFDGIPEDFWEGRKIHILVLPFRRFETLRFNGGEMPKNGILYGSTTLGNMPRNQDVVFLWELNVKILAHELSHIILKENLGHSVAPDETIIRRMVLRFMISKQLKEYLRNNLK